MGAPGGANVGGRTFPQSSFSSKLLWSLGCLALLGLIIAVRTARLNILTRELSAAKEKISEQRAVAVARKENESQSLLTQEELDFQSHLQDPGWLSGATARELHQQEWKLRLAHDPQYARTILETNLLLMEQLGQDANLAAQTALEKVAQLASPPRARVEVVPDGDGYRVRVAYMMSSLSRQESGAVTKHHTTESMRGEIQELSARVLRDLYSYCGSRGIRSIAVTCNHTLRQTVNLDGATEEEQAELSRRAAPVLARVYRVSLDQARAGSVLNWRKVSLSRIIRLYAVEYDGLTQITITHDQPGVGNQPDAEGELKF